MSVYVAFGLLAIVACVVFLRETRKAMNDLSEVSLFDDIVEEEVAALHKWLSEDEVLNVRRPDA